MESVLLKDKDERDILNPQAKPFIAGGKTFNILPMPDSKLMRVGEEMAGAAETIAGVIELVSDSGMASSVVGAIPHLIKTLIPVSSGILSIVLDESPEWVAENLPLAKRVEALRIVFQVEDIPLLLKNWHDLTEMFQPIPSVEIEPIG